MLVAFCWNGKAAYWTAKAEDARDFMDSVDNAWNTLCMLQKAGKSAHWTEELVIPSIAEDAAILTVITAWRFSLKTKRIEHKITIIIM